VNRPASRGRKKASLATENASCHHPWDFHTGRMSATIDAAITRAVRCLPLFFLNSDPSMRCLSRPTQPFLTPQRTEARANLHRPRSHCAATAESPCTDHGAPADRPWSHRGVILEHPQSTCEWILDEWSTHALPNRQCCGMALLPESSDWEERADLTRSERRVLRGSDVRERGALPGAAMRRFSPPGGGVNKGHRHREKDADAHTFVARGST